MNKPKTYQSEVNMDFIRKVSKDESRSVMDVKLCLALLYENDGLNAKIWGLKNRINFWMKLDESLYVDQKLNSTDDVKESFAYIQAIDVIKSLPFPEELPDISGELMAPVMNGYEISMEAAVQLPSGNDFRKHLQLVKG